METKLTSETMWRVSPYS